MERAFRRTVAAGDHLADAESLDAYSYDASGRHGRPALVLRPRDEEQLRRILVTANQSRTPVVPRGSGTGNRGGAVREGAVVVDLRAFDAVTRLDRQRLTIDVGAGATMRRLAAALARFGLRFPLVPENDLATLGGLAAENRVGEESQLFGDWLELVERVECFDGLGRFQTLKGKDVAKVIGWEGTTGIITKLRLKVTDATAKTMELEPVADAGAALAAAERLAAAPRLLSLEYYDARCAALVGLPGQAHVVATYADDTGSYKDTDKVSSLGAARRRLPLFLWREGFTAVEETTVAPERLAPLLALCAKEGLPCYGHLGIGVLMAQLPADGSVEGFRGEVVALGARPEGKYGFGRAKRGYVTPERRKEALHLKEERDYNHILNPGVIV